MEPTNKLAELKARLAAKRRKANYKKMPKVTTRDNTRWGYNSNGGGAYATTCRTALPKKDNFICWDCRTTTRSFNSPLSHGNSYSGTTCPKCRKPMFKLGKYARVPRKKAPKTIWRNFERLYRPKPQTADFNETLKNHRK